MPTYEYECSSCGYRFEAFQGIAEDPLKSCPECGGGVRRLIGTGSGIIFKGSGFYQTDYKLNGSKKQKADDGACPKQDKGQGCGSCPVKQDKHD